MKQLLFKNGRFIYQDFSDEKVADLLEVDMITRAATLEALGDNIDIYCDDEFLLKMKGVRDVIQYESYCGHVETLFDNVLFRKVDNEGGCVDLTQEDLEKILENIEVYKWVDPHGLDSLKIKVFG